MIVALIEKVYSFLWGDLIHIPLPGGGSVGISLLIILLIPTGIYFTVRTRLLPIRMFPDMIKALTGKKENKDSLSTFQTLIVSTATRVGMGNLVGVVAAISVGGAGAVFWMWITAIIGSSTAFVEATLAQLHKEPDPLYSGYRGGPAYYIHHYFEDKSGKKKKHVIIAVLFAISGLICWCGISQVISNSVTSSFENAFGVPPIYTTIILVAVAAVIVLRKNATVKVLDIVVPIMAVCYFAITIFIIIKNIGMMPSVFSRIFEEAFGIRQVAAGGFGAVLMNGVKRGLFSNEAGSGSAPCAAAAAEMRSRLYQALDDQLQKQPENQWLYQQQVRLQNAHICTISSFCFDLIRDNLTEQGITAGFRILNETEAKLIASKAADTVLNRWHAERQEEMQLLWNCFCEKNDKPLEELLLELHSFLGSVPFREQWTKQVLEELNQPLSDSAYHRAFLAQLERRAETAVRLANEAADLAAVVYDSVPDNNVLPWVETDVRCLEKVLQMLRQQEPDAEKILAPIQEKNQNRGNFPRKKKAMTDLEAFERVKEPADID